MTTPETPEIVELTAEIPAELDKQRLDRALASLFPDYSRARLQQWIKAGEVTLDGQITNQRTPVKAGQTVNLSLDENSQVGPLSPQERDRERGWEGTWKPQPGHLNILHEDEHIIILNKPARLVVHPGAGNPDGTLVNLLLHHDPKLINLPRAGIVHRLDKDTTGVMMVARTLEAHTHLVRAIQNREVKREYEAIVEGNIIAGGTIETNIGRHPRARTKMAVVSEDQGKPAITHYRVIKRFEHYTHVKVILETGRTHQIRVHMAHVHHPIVGDRTYAGRLKFPKNIGETLKEKIKNFTRQALHAKKLTLVHPSTKEEMSFKAELPDDMKSLLMSFSGLSGR